MTQALDWPGTPEKGDRHPAAHKLEAAGQLSILDQAAPPAKKERRPATIQTMDRKDFADTLRLMGFTEEATPYWPIYRHPEFEAISFAGVVSRSGVTLRRETIDRLKAALDRERQSCGR